MLRAFSDPLSVNLRSLAGFGVFFVVAEIGGTCYSPAKQNTFGVAQIKFSLSPIWNTKKMSWQRKAWSFYACAFNYFAPKRTCLLL